MSNRIVDEQLPADDEHDERLELEPFSKGTGDQQGRDRREHHLEEAEEGSGNVR